MKYCRFRFENEVLYGKVEDRGGEPWIVDLARAPEEDLAFRVRHQKAVPSILDFEPLALSSAELLAPVTPSSLYTAPGPPGPK